MCADEPTNSLRDNRYGKCVAVMLSSPASAYLFPHAALVLLMVAGHGGNGGTKDS